MLTKLTLTVNIVGATISQPDIRSPIQNDNRPRDSPPLFNFHHGGRPSDTNSLDIESKRIRVPSARTDGQIRSRIDSMSNFIQSKQNMSLQYNN